MKTLKNTLALMLCLSINIVVFGQLTINYQACGSNGSEVIGNNGQVGYIPSLPDTLYIGCESIKFTSNNILGIKITDNLFNSISSVEDLTLEIEFADSLYLKIITTTNDNFYIKVIYDPALSIDENEIPISELIAYPNPTKNQLTILFPETHEIPSHIQLLDLMGKVVLERKEDNTLETTLDVSYLAPGTYFLQAGNVTQKVVVEWD